MGTTGEASEKRAGIKKPQQAKTCGAMGDWEGISYILHS
jgi:hypothetical protein